MKATMKATYEIQQDNFRVIRTGPDGVRRAWDNPPCRSQREAALAIKQYRAEDADPGPNPATD